MSKDVFSKVIFLTETFHTNILPIFIINDLTNDLRITEKIGFFRQKYSCNVQKTYFHLVVLLIDSFTSLIMSFLMLTSCF